MSTIPAENRLWLHQFKARLELEKSCVRMLIQWGLTECAFEVYRFIEERFVQIEEVGSYLSVKGQGEMRTALTREHRFLLRDLIQTHFTKTRDIPRDAQTQQLLQNGLLTGYESLLDQLSQFIEQYDCQSRKICSMGIAA
jgi:hypothetical protein